MNRCECAMLASVEHMKGSYVGPGTLKVTQIYECMACAKKRAAYDNNVRVSLVQAGAL